MSRMGFLQNCYTCEGMLMCLDMSEGHGREGNSKLKIKEGSSHEAHSKRKQNIKNDWLRITDPIL